MLRNSESSDLIDPSPVVSSDVTFANLEVDLIWLVAAVIELTKPCNKV